MLKAIKGFWTATISRQLMLGIALVHALLMTVFVFDLVSRERAFLIEQSRDEALSLAEALAANGTSWVLAHDVVGMEELITAQSSYPGLRYAMLIDTEGRVLAYTERSKVGSYLADEVSRTLLTAVPTPRVLVNSADLIDVAAPVLAGGDLIGWARVGIGRDQITANLQRVTSDGLGYTAVAIGVGLVFAWFMAVGLTRGIRRLAAASQRLRLGERDVDFRLERRDELGSLAESFAAMVHALADREREAAENSALLHSIINATPDLIFFKDTEGRYLGCNRAFAESVHLPQAEIPGKDDYDLFERDVAEQFRADDAAVLAAEQMASYEEPMDTPDGHDSLVETLKTPYYGPGGELLGIVGISRDITARKQAEEQIRRSRASLAEAQRIGRIGSWELDLATSTLTWSEELYRLFRVDPNSFESTYEAFLQIVHPDDRAKVDREYRASVQSGARYQVEHRIVLPDGGIRYVEEQGETEFDRDGTPLRSFGTVQDITERHLSREALERKQAHLDWLAHYDSLTHLPNRVLFRDRLAQAIRHAERAGEKVATLFVDLDEFKQINDSLGHAVGDEVLTAVARRFERVVRDSDSVARLGGDEFTVVLGGLRDPQHVSRVAQQLIEVLHEPIRVDDRDLFVSTSVGISVYPDDSQEIDSLLSNADAAMFRAKEKGRNTFQFYTEDMTATAYNRIQLDAELRRALKEEEFRLYYQPQYALATGRLTGMEALLRWQHPEHGMVPPNRFIPAAEASGLILSIGDWVLEEASRQVRRWHDQGLTPGRVSINLSGKQIYQKDLPERVSRIIDGTGCRAEWLGLEVTEGFIMTNPEQSIALLTELRDMGLGLAIDDFGTGYSSLAYLKQLPIDTLKIDKSFVRDIPVDPNDMAIAQAVIALGQSLGMGVLAEGIETEAQERFLQSNGCGEGQGYRYSRPVPAEAITALLEKAAGRAPNSASG